MIAVDLIAPDGARMTAFVATDDFDFERWQRERAQAFALLGITAEERVMQLTDAGNYRVPALVDEFDPVYRIELNVQLTDTQGDDDAFGLVRDLQQDCTAALITARIVTPEGAVHMLDQNGAQHAVVP